MCFSTSSACWCIEHQDNEQQFLSALFLQEYSILEDVRQLTEAMKVLERAVNPQRISITWARSHICMRSRFSYSIFIKPWVPALFTWWFALSAVNRRCWASLIYLQVLFCLCVCVSVWGGGSRSGGAVGVSCPVSNSVEPDLATSVTWHGTVAETPGRQGENKRDGERERDREMYREKKQQYKNVSVRKVDEDLEM